MATAYYTTEAGEIVEGDDANDADYKNQGLRPATDEDVRLHNQKLEFEAKGIAGKAEELIQTGGEALIRPASTLVAGAVEAGAEAFGTTPGELAGTGQDINIRETPAFSPESMARARAHPNTVMGTQIAAAAPLLLTNPWLAIPAESAIGAGMVETEQAWMQNRKLSLENIGLNTLTGVALGGGFMGAGLGLQWAGRRGLQAAAKTQLGRKALDKFRPVKAPVEIDVAEFQRRHSKLAEKYGSAENIPLEESTKIFEDWVEDEIAASRVKDLLGGTGRQAARSAIVEGENRAVRETASDILGQAERQPQKTAREILSQDADALEYLYRQRKSLRKDLSFEASQEATILRNSFEDLVQAKLTRKEMRDLLQGDVSAQARQISRLESAVRETRELLKQSGDESLLKGLNKKLQGLDKGEDVVAWYERGIDISEDVEKIRRNFQGDPELGNVLEGLQGRIRQTLEDGVAWGSLAEQEAGRFAASGRRFSDAVSQFDSAFVAGPKRIVTPNRVGKTLGEGAAAKTAGEAFDSFLDTAEVAARKARAEGQDDVARDMLGRIEKLRRGRGRGRALKDVEELRSRGQTGKGSGDNFVKDLATDLAVDWAASQAFEGLPPGISSAVRLAKRFGLLRTFGNMRRGNNVMLQRGVRTFLHGTEAVGRGVQRGAPAISLLGSSMAHWSSLRGHIRQMATDPQYFAEHMNESLGDLGEIAPELYRGLSDQTMRAMAFLEGKLPGKRMPGPFGEELRPSDDELWEAEQYARGALDPSSVYAGLEDGSLNSLQMEAFEAVFPEKYSELRMGIWQEMQKMTSEGIPIPLDPAEKMDTLFDLDGGGIEALSWRVAERGKDALSMSREAPQGPGGGAPETAERTASPSLASLSKGAMATA